MCRFMKRGSVMSALSSAESASPRRPQEQRLDSESAGLTMGFLEFSAKSLRVALLLQN